MQLLSDYLGFLEGLADAHTAINHVSGSSDERGFFIVEWESFLQGLASGIQLPGDSTRNTVMYGISYNWGYGGQPSNLLKDYEAGFAILQHVDEVDDFDQITEALSHCERITHEINMRIAWEAVHQDNPLFNGEFAINSFTITPVLRRAHNYYGVICQFEFQNFAGACVDGSRWADLDDETVNAL